MKEYYISLTESNILLYQEIENDKHKRRYGKSAYEAIKKINTTNHKEEIIGNDKRLIGSSYIYIENYKDVYKELNNLNIPKQILKKAAIGFAGVATLGALSIGISSSTDQEVITPVIETVEEEKHDEMIVKQPQVNEYTENISTLPPDDNIAYVDVDAVYDEGLDANISRYEDIINEVSNRWGIDPNLLIDVVKQESSGGSLQNKGQVQYKSWEDMKLVCYNFEKNKYQTIVFTNDQSKYKRGVNEPDYIFINSEEFQNKYTSFSSTALLLSYIYNNMAGKNLTRTLAIYNQGYTASNKVYQEQARVENIPYDILINDEKNTDYYKYSYVLDTIDENGNVKHHGDPYYIQNVLKQGTQTFNLDVGKSYTMNSVDDNDNVFKNTTRYQSSYKKELAHR